MFPLKHCTTRWLENVSCVDRILPILDDIKLFVDSKKNINTKPMKNVSEQTKDIFIKCKLAFFKTISSECEPFLSKFQTSDPLAPYLLSDLQILVNILLERFIERDKKATTISELFSLNRKDKSNLCDLKNIDIGFQTKKMLKEVKAKDSEIEKFRLVCQIILTTTTEKLLEKCLIKYKTVQGLFSLDPNIIYNEPDQGKKRVNILLESFYYGNRISDSVAEKSKAQYNSICKEAHTSYETIFKTYLENASCSSRLDDFYSSFLMGNQKYEKLWKVIK